MKISKSANQFAQRVFRMCLENGVLDEQRLSQSISFLSKNKPNEFRSVLIALRKLVRLDLDKRTAHIESAQELDTLEKRRISNSLAERHGDHLIYHFSVNSDLIAGLRVRIGSQVFDGSVRSKINRLANSL